MRHGFALFRLHSALGTLVAGLVVLAGLGGVLWLGLLAHVTYRTADADACLVTLLDPSHYRYLSANALTKAAELWAGERGVETHPDWIRVRIADNRPRTSPTAIGGDTTGDPEVDQAVRALGGTIGRAPRTAAVDVGIRMRIHVRSLFVVRSAVIEAHVDYSAEGGYQTTSDDVGWDELGTVDDPPEAGLWNFFGAPAPERGLPPLPAPTRSVLDLLAALRASETDLAHHLGRATLESAQAPGGQRPTAAETAQARARLKGARTAVEPYLAGDGRGEVEDWIGEDGAQGLEATVRCAVLLDVIWAAAGAPRADAAPLIGPYLDRRRAARQTLDAALSDVGVLAP